MNLWTLPLAFFSWALWFAYVRELRQRGRLLDLIEGFCQDAYEGVVYPARANEARQLRRAHGREVDA